MERGGLIGESGNQQLKMLLCLLRIKAFQMRFFQRIFAIVFTSIIGTSVKGQIIYTDIIPEKVVIPHQLIFNNSLSWCAL